MLRLYLGGGPVGGPSDITHSATWLSLVPNLSNETRNEVEYPSNTVNVVMREHGGPVRILSPLHKVSEEVDALERKWKLV
jgi:hypothetical protein